MPQLHLYVSDEEADRIKEQAQSRGQSVSKFLADVVKRELGESWPDGFFEDVVGGWKGDPLVRSEQGALQVRDSF